VTLAVLVASLDDVVLNQARGQLYLFTFNEDDWKDHHLRNKRARCNVCCCFNGLMILFNYENIVGE